MNSLHRKALGVLAGLAGLFAAGLALAVQPDEVLQDAALEARARALSAELRCLVCQNQSIDDSNAPLARDLRLLVRERLTAGDSDAAVKSFVVERYGTFVLLRPPVDASTILLWMTPLLILAGALMLLLRRMTSGARLVREPVPELSPEDQERLRILLEEPRRAPPNGSHRA